MPRGETVVCTACEATAPLTMLWEERANAMQERFWGLLPVEEASALLWYVEGSPWRDAVHRFKYAGRWLSAYDLGRWYGALLKESGAYADVDVIVPVPLHWRRRLVRGYNQTEYIALGLSRKTGIKCCRNAVKRTVNNPPQAGMEFINRWQHIENIFTTPHPERLKGKHILLVDDVFTSGATLSTLAQSIIKACDGDVKISVATLAASRHLADK